MRLQLEKRLLFLSLLCILSKVCAQLCRRPCYCPWVPPRCPRGSPLVLDGCGCCKICARRLGEPCDYLHVCDQSQGLVCDYSTAPTGTGATCNFEESEEGCEVNGRLYRDGEVFQPSCKLQCRCLDGGFTCVPLCQEDVRLPTPDCPFPRRVEIPGKCCPEWICEARDQHLLRDAGAAPGAVSPLLPYPCQEWGTEWSACSVTCGVGFSTRVSNQNRYCRLETQRRLCMARPCPALPAASPANNHEPSHSAWPPPLQSADGLAGLRRARSSDEGDTAPQHQTYGLPSKHIPRQPRPKEKQEKRENKLQR